MVVNRAIDGMEWYAVRCIFKDDESAVFEERITVWRRGSMELAIEAAESEALTYIRHIQFTYTGLAQGYRLFGDSADSLTGEIGDGQEVFSLCRLSNLSTNDYLSQFFDTGSDI